jgi:hypothetical protein
VLGDKGLLHQHPLLVHGKFMAISRFDSIPF